MTIIFLAICFLVLPLNVILQNTVDFLQDIKQHFSSTSRLIQLEQEFFQLEYNQRYENNSAYDMLSLVVKEGEVLTLTDLEVEKRMSAERHAFIGTSLKALLNLLIFIVITVALFGRIGIFLFCLLTFLIWLFNLIHNIIYIAHQTTLQMYAHEKGLSYEYVLKKPFFVILSFVPSVYCLYIGLVLLGVLV